MDNIKVFTLQMGIVTLSAAHIDKTAAFYERILGLKELESYAAGRTLGAGDRGLVRLVDAPMAKSNNRGPGLYHFAIRVPDRFSLARVLYQLAERNYPLQGAADHGVSEAIYLADPEGNGIEIYRDRDRSEWPKDENGQVDMFTDELNLEHLLFELKGKLDPWVGMDSRTDMGHIHLQVNNLEAAKEYYTKILGLDLQAAYGDQAAFLSADGYHHHVGINTWRSLNAEPAPADSAGLAYYQIIFHSKENREAIKERTLAAGLSFTETGEGYLVSDPSGNRIVLSLV